MQQLARVDAVNEILKVKTAERIGSLSEIETVPQAGSANDELNMATIRIQTDDKWFFNTVENGRLISNDDGEVILPNNLGFISIHSTTAPVPTGNLRPVAGKIYDNYNMTFDLGGPGQEVRFSGKLVWDFEDLPVAFQLLAVARARMEVVGSGSHISAQRLAIEQGAYNVAKAAVMKFDDTLSGGRLRNAEPSRKRGPKNRGWV